MFERILQSDEPEMHERLYVVGAGIHALIAAVDAHYAPAMQELVDQDDRIARAAFPHRVPRTFLMDTLNPASMVEAPVANIDAPAFDFEAARPAPVPASHPVARAADATEHDPATWEHFESQFDERSAAINEALEGVFAAHDEMNGTATPQTMPINPAWNDVNNQESINA